MKLKKSCLAVGVMAASVGSAYAAGMAGMAGMDMSKMSDMDMMKMPGMSHMSHTSMPQQKPAAKTRPAKAKPSKTVGMQQKAASKSVTTSAQTSHQQMTMDMSHMDHSQMQHHQMDMSHTDHSQMSHDQMDMSDMTHDQSMAGMDMSHMDHGQMSHDQMKMSGMDMGSRAGERDSDYSDGRDFGPLMPPHMMAAGVLYGVRANTLEWVHQDHQSSVATSGTAWLGTDANRAVLDWDGSFNNQAKNKLDDGALQLVWRQPLSPFWNYDLGARAEYQQGAPQNSQQEHGGHNRQWLAANLNGFAPYRFEVNATALLGTQGRTALKLDADYDLHITQRLVLQPELATTVYGKSDREMLRGAGLSDMTGAVRLRYELSRQFAPYIGYQYSRYMGQTAEFYRAEGKDSRASQVMAGIRFWY